MSIDQRKSEFAALYPTFDSSFFKSPFRLKSVFRDQAATSTSAARVKDFWIVCARILFLWLSCATCYENVAEYLHNNHDLMHEFKIRRFPAFFWLSRLRRKVELFEKRNELESKFWFRIDLANFIERLIENRDVLSVSNLPNVLIIQLTRAEYVR